MALLIAGLVLFLGIHSVQMIAPGFRQSVIENRGDNTWKGIYSIVSLAGLVLLVWGYGAARVSDANTFFYSGPGWLTHVVWILMAVAMIFFIASQLPAGRIKKALKNPMLISVKTWAIAHLLVNGDLAGILFFGSFLIWAVLLVINTNRRGNPEPETISQRSDILAVVIGLVVWVVFALVLHEWLIGVPVIA